MLGPEIAAYLAAQGYGTVNVNGFYNIVPADPDVLFSVLEYGGEADEPDLGKGGATTRLEFARFQVLMRGIRDDSDGPALRSLNARVTLVAVVNQVLSGVRYLGIDCLGPPNLLERDENFRVYWTVNYRAFKVPSTS